MYDPPWESSEHALTNPYTRIDLPADVKRYLCELAALAEQVRKWEKETEAFAQLLVATAVLTASVSAILYYADRWVG